MWTAQQDTDTLIETPSQSYMLCALPMHPHVGTLLHAHYACYDVTHGMYSLDMNNLIADFYPCTHSWWHPVGRM
jgi:hypothetical protein